MDAMKPKKRAEKTGSVNGGSSGLAIEVKLVRWCKSRDHLAATFETQLSIYSGAIDKPEDTYEILKSIVLNSK
jgi:hypothetical protein